MDIPFPSTKAVLFSLFIDLGMMDCEQRINISFYYSTFTRSGQRVESFLEKCESSGMFTTGSCQAPLSTGFSRQEYWNGLPCPPPADLPHPGIEHRSPALQADSFTAESLGKPLSHTPQNCQGHQKHIKSEKPSHPRSTYGNLMTKCHMVSWVEFGNRKRTLGEN